MGVRDIGVTILILVLLVILGAAGEYNYQRNKAAEENSVPRKYRGYSDQELATLIHAYEQEVEALEARYDSAKSVAIETRSGGLIDEQIGEFERAQQASASVRSKRTDVAKQEGILRELREERSLRRGGSDSLTTHLRRLVTI
jgi:hypothetical protein